MRRTLLLASAWLALAGSCASASTNQRLGDRPTAPDFDYRVPPAIATGPDGRSVALMYQGGSVAVRRARPGHRFGAARRLPLGTSASSATVAAGNAFAALAWTHFDATFIPVPYDRDAPCCRRVRAALITRSGRVMHPRTLSAPRANVYTIFAAARGRRAAIAWTDSLGVRTGTGIRGRGFRRPVTISSRAQELIGVAVPRATPHVFYVAGVRKLRVVEAWRSGGHTRRRTLGPFPGGRLDFRAAVAPAGQLLIARDTFNRSRGRRLLILSRRPGGRLRTMSVPLRGRGFSAIALALAPSGIGFVVTSASTRRMTLRSVDRSGHVGHARVLRTGRTTVEAAVAIDRSGAGVLAARLYGGTSRRRRDRVAAWRLGSGGRVGPRHTLNPPGGLVGGPLGVTAAGRVTWLQHRGVYGTLVR
jgi:hypothetical protein